MHTVEMTGLFVWYTEQCILLVGAGKQVLSKRLSRCRHQVQGFVESFRGFHMLMGYYLSCPKRAYFSSSSHIKQGVWSMLAKVGKEFIVY